MLLLNVSYLTINTCRVSDLSWNDIKFFGNGTHKYKLIVNVRMRATCVWKREIWKQSARLSVCNRSTRFCRAVFQYQCWFLCDYMCYRNIYSSATSIFYYVAGSDMKTSRIYNLINLLIADTRDNLLYLPIK